MDSHLVTPETRTEMVDGVVMETMASLPPHGDTYFDFALVLGALLQPGYIGSIDLLTRFGEKDNFAADIALRREGVDPETASRYLEEVVFEVGDTQRKAELTNKAGKMVARGVRRMFAVLVQEQKLYEWDAVRGDLVKLSGDILDPATLLCPLPV